MGVNNEYIEVAVGGVSNRGSICKASDLGKYLKPDLELYRSLYRLDNSAIEHFEANKTLSASPPLQECIVSIIICGS